MAGEICFDAEHCINIGLFASAAVCKALGPLASRRSSLTLPRVSIGLGPFLRPAFHSPSSYDVIPPHTHSHPRTQSPTPPQSWHREISPLGPTGVSTGGCKGVYRARPRFEAGLKQAALPKKGGRTGWVPREWRPSTRGWRASGRYRSFGASLAPCEGSARRAQLTYRDVMILVPTDRLISLYEVNN